MKTFYKSSEVPSSLMAAGAGSSLTSSLTAVIPRIFKSDHLNRAPRIVCG